MPKKKENFAKTRGKRVSKAQWLHCALDVLEDEGIGGVRIERLARKLGIAKAGFYWHFANRDELLREMLNIWTHQYTEVVTKGLPALVGSPKKRLLETMKMVSEHQLARYELSMRSWAATDPDAARAVRRVYKMRLRFLASIFEDLGFRGAEIEMRTKMFVCYYSWSPTMFPQGTKAVRDKLMKQQLKWFCQK